MIINCDAFIAEFTTPEWNYGRYIGNNLFYRLIVDGGIFANIGNNTKDVIYSRREIELSQLRDVSFLLECKTSAETKEALGDIASAINDYLLAIADGRLSYLYLYYYCAHKAVSLTRKLLGEGAARKVMGGIITPTTMQNRVGGKH